MHLLSSFSLNQPFYEHKKRPSYVVVTQKNRLSEMVLLSTQNIFWAVKTDG